MGGWIGCDLDGTIAEYEHGNFKGPGVIGKPIAPMVERVKKLLAEGNDVRIMTARVYYPRADELTGVIDYENARLRKAEAREAKYAIELWCKEHIGKVLPVTCVKDYSMWYLMDDRAKQVVPNKGALLEERYEDVILSYLALFKENEALKAQLAAAQQSADA